MERRVVYSPYGQEAVLDPNLDRFWGMHAEAVGAKAKINLISFVLQTWPLPARPLRTGGDARLHP